MKFYFIQFFFQQTANTKRVAQRKHIILRNMKRTHNFLSIASFHFHCQAGPVLTLCTTNQSSARWADKIELITHLCDFFMEFLRLLIKFPPFNLIFGSLSASMEFIDYIFLSVHRL